VDHENNIFWGGARGIFTAIFTLKYKLEPICCDFVGPDTCLKYGKSFKHVIRKPQFESCGLAVEYSPHDRGFDPCPMLNGSGVKAMQG